MNIKAFCAALLFVGGGFFQTHAAPMADTLDTRIGQLQFTHDFNNGYPTRETQRLLLEEMDFQRACQVYLWAMPLVSMAQWQHAYSAGLGAGNGQIVYFDNYRDKLGGLTFNATTPYVSCFLDLTQEPWVVELPEGEIRGSAVDFWQISFAGFESGKKYIIVAPGQDELLQKLKKKKGYTVVQASTNNLLAGFRTMSADPGVQMEMLNATRIYPLSELGNPRPRGWLRPEGKTWQAWHPRGMAYWERLSDIINREPVHERDRFFMAMLAPLGIEKGKPFAPDAGQRKILEEAALVGEAMAKANDFHNTRIRASVYRPGSYWEYATVCPPDQRHEHYDDLDGRAAWFYEAVTNSPGMHGQKTGKGQIYLAAYNDSQGGWLDGAESYTLRLPAGVPVASFWSLTLYDLSGRALLDNGEQKADLSSRMDLTVNPDGSIDLYMGPEKPADPLKAKNWIQTIPGKSWFCYFRLYSPLPAFMDGEWVLPDIRRTSVSDQDIADAYCYLIGRELILKQQRIDFEQEGFRWNTLLHREPGEVGWANPNLDVAYSEAWIAVDEQSYVLLDIPEIKGRYYTWQMLNGWGETLLNINERTFPHHPHGRFALCLAGSRVEIPDGCLRIDLPTRMSRVLMRVELGADVEEAKRLQHSFKLTQVGTPEMPGFITVPLFSGHDLPGADIFRNASCKMESERDINPGMEPLQNKVKAVEQLVNSSEAAFRRVDQVVRSKALPAFLNTMGELGISQNGWTRPKVFGNYRDNYAMRSIINLGGIWANNSGEVVYYVKNGNDGGRTYTITFPKEALPSDKSAYFWSLIAVDGINYHVLPNPLERYLLNNRSALRYNPDGSLTLVCGPEPLPGYPAANWLPTLPGQKYNLVFRLYGPSPDVVDARYFPPELTPVQP